MTRIPINSEDLPIETLIGKDALQVVPRFKGVAAATFDMTLSTITNIVVLQADGQPLPPGIDVRSARRATALLSGYGGALSIDAARVGERFEAWWRTGQCTFELGAPDQTAQPLQTTTYVCTPLDAAAS